MAGGAGSSAAGSLGNAPNQPDVPLSATGQPMLGTALAGLEIQQSHFFVDPDARPAGTWSWLVVVKSTRSDPACSLRLDADFVSSGGRTLQFLGSVSAHVFHVPGSTGALRCIGPGEVGVGAGAPIASVGALSPSDITEIHYAFSGTTAAAAVPADWVTLSNIALVSAPNGAGVSGTLSNGTAQIPSWGVDVFPRNAAGMPLAAFFLSDPRNVLVPGATWNFETPVYQGAFEDAYVFERHGNAATP